MQLSSVTSAKPSQAEPRDRPAEWIDEANLWGSKIDERRRRKKNPLSSLLLLCWYCWVYRARLIDPSGSERYPPHPTQPLEAGLSRRYLAFLAVITFAFASTWSGALLSSRVLLLK